MRIIEAKLLPTAPRFRRTRATGVKRDGLRFERLFAETLARQAPDATVLRNPWFSYRTDAAPEKEKLCSPDLLVVWDGRIFLFECKRSALISAYDKIAQLYVPVVSIACGNKHPVHGTQVFKFLTKQTLLAYPVRPITAAFSPPARISGLHWLG